MTTVREQAVKVAKLLGDSTYEIWSLEELEQHVADSYLDFAISTSALWDSAHVPDRHSPAYITDKFTGYGLGSRRVYRPWVPSPGGTSRSNRGVSGELQLVLTSDPTPFLGGGERFSNQDGAASLITSAQDVPYCSDPPPAITLLPPEVANVERATYDGRRLTAVTPQEANKADPQWEQYTGLPFAYALIQKGIRKLLKRFRGPTVPADTRAYTSEVGILRGGMHVPDLVTVNINAPVRINLTPFADFNQTFIPGTPKSFISTLYPYPGFTPSVYSFPTSPPTYGWPALTEHATTPVVGGPFGLPRRVPGAWYTNGPFGFPKRWNPGRNNTRIDYVRRAQAVQHGRFEIQDWDVRYVRFFTLAKALDRDGPGQNKKLAKHYMDRYNLGLSMIAKRHAEVREATNHIMGGGVDDAAELNPLARLPTNYGVNR